MRETITYAITVNPCAADMAPRGPFIVSCPVDDDLDALRDHFDQAYANWLNTEGIGNYGLTIEARP